MHLRMAITTSLLATTLATASIVAQNGATDRGSILVAGSGSITWWKASTSDNRRFTADLNPRIGFFIIDGPAVNANLQYVRQSVESGTSSRWGVGPGLTYYFCSPERRVHPFLTARSLFSWSHSTWDSNRAVGKNHDLYWLAGGCVIVMLVRYVGLSTEVFYQWSEHDYAPDRSPPISEQLYGVRFGVAAFLF